MRSYIEIMKKMKKKQNLKINLPAFSNTDIISPFMFSLYTHKEFWLTLSDGHLANLKSINMNMYLLSNSQTKPATLVLLNRNVQMLKYDFILENIFAATITVH